MVSKKAQKMRGSKTYGYGSKKKHRGKGSRGGRGFAGSHKHNYSHIVKYKPNHFGYKGFYSLKKKPKTINIKDLKKIAKGSEIDLTAMGIDKLLSTGEIEKPLTVKVIKFSKQAKEKIEKAGGKIV